VRARLRGDYAVQYSDPIAVAEGDAVTVIRRDEQFTRWLWCVGPDGRSGWVPETGLTATEPGPSRMTVTYQATELGARRGEMVEVIHEFDGFAWVESADGRRGWVPVAVLEPAPEASSSD
jgi:SH3-like domain-containing protein